MPTERTKNSAAKGKEASAHKSATQHAPDWPKIDLRYRVIETQLRTVREGQIVTIPNFWPQNLCKQYVAFLAKLPLTTTPGKPKKGEAVRVNDRFQVQDKAFAESLWTATGLKELVSGFDVKKTGVQSEDVEDGSYWGGQVVGLNPNIRIYRYRPGQYFDQHCKLKSD